MKRPPTISIATGLPRPRWRGRIHTYAFVLMMPAGIVLLLAADTVRARLAAALFAVSMAAVFGVSAAYHRLARSERAQQVMQQVDHAMIYLLIGATYTAVCTVALPARWWIPMVSAVWVTAAAGVAVRIWAPPQWTRLSNGLYLGMGWVAIVGLPALVRHVAPSALVLLVVGGVLYTAGAIVFYRRRPDPAPSVFGYHEVWHVFTVLAGASHFAMVAVVTAG